MTKDARYVGCPRCLADYYLECIGLAEGEFHTERQVLWLSERVEELEGLVEELQYWQGRVQGK